MLRSLLRASFASGALVSVCCTLALAQTPGQSDLLRPRDAGRALPELPPRAAKPPQPSPGAPSPAPASVQLSTAPQFVLRAINIDGNTVLDQPSIDPVIAPYLGKPVSLADLEEIRRALTLLYVNRGFLNSGFTIPNQNVENGVILFRAVEGRVTAVEVTGTDHFAPDYFRDRLVRGLTAPFNIADLERRQQILLQDPLLRRLNIELQPGLSPGEGRIHADVLEANPYAVGLQIANSQSPTVGEIRGQIQGSAANILGYGDILSVQYGRSQGINDGTVAYSLPIASDDTRISVRYDINGTVVVTPALSPLNITSRYNSLAVGISRPFYRTAEQNLTLGSSIERRDAQTFLLSTPFSFTAGSSSGKTNVTALRLYEDFVDRDAEHVLALRTTLSFGLDALGATVTSATPNGKFVAVLAQAQYLRRVFEDWEALLRSDLQIASKPLFPIEQFALGGIDTVRGYRQFLTVTDNAAFASGELHIPIARLRLPYFADTEEAGSLQFVPFYDYGRAWNNDRPTPYPAEISGVGAGLRWLIGSGISAEVYYAKALRHVNAGTALQDRGIYFRLIAKAY